VVGCFFSNFVKSFLKAAKVGSDGFSVVFVSTGYTKFCPDLLE